MRFQILASFRRFIRAPWGNGFTFGVLAGLLLGIALYWVGYLVGYIL